MSFAVRYARCILLSGESSGRDCRGLISIIALTQEAFLWSLSLRCRYSSRNREVAVPTVSNQIAFAFVALAMVLTPGPNMIYLISRSICQGRTAGLISLGGVALGFVFYMLCAALGITALVMAVPYAYDALRIGGALYLLYLAWQAVKPGGRSPFHVRDLPTDSPRKLFTMGFITN